MDDKNIAGSYITKMILAVGVSTKYCLSQFILDVL